jgi:hypothetical protein
MMRRSHKIFPMPRLRPFPKNTKVGDWRRVSKIEAAEAQLHTAIQLYFTSSDYVSVHTLWFASASIINSLLKLNGHEEILCPDIIRPEARDLWLATIADAPNFFKHSGRDPKAQVDFLPANDDFNLVTAVIGLQTLTKKRTRIMTALLYWVLAHHPEVRKDDSFDHVFEGLKHAGLLKNKAEFFAAMISAGPLPTRPALP